MPSDVVRPSGHLQVKGSRGARAFYALVRDAEGRHQRRLGPAWVKDSGRRTPRGAVKWIARDGTAPDGHLTPAAAEDLLQQLLATAPRKVARATRATQKRGLTLREGCDAWLRDAEREGEVKHSTLSDYGHVADRICRDLGASTTVASLTPARLGEFISGLMAERWVSHKEARARRAAGGTVNLLADGRHVHVTAASTRTREKYRTALNGVMECAVEFGAIDANPMVGVKRPGRARKRHRRTSLASTHFLRPTEVHALVRAASDVERQDGTMFLTMAFCGLRLGEALDLRWGAISFEGSSMLVESSFVRERSDTPKSGVGRVVPMALEVSEALATHAKQRVGRSDADLVFLGKRGGHVDANRLRLRFYIALEAAGVKRVRIHDLRHTFGTVCAAAGIPQTTLKEWMGHADLATTELYTAYYPQASDAARISAAFAEQSVGAGPLTPAAG
jgi:integrase